MKAITGLAAAATVVLTGCGAAATTAGTKTGATAATHASAPLSCHQQYKTWQHGPARPLGKQILPALKKVETAASFQDIPRLDAALKDAGNIARQLAAYPMPHCADPEGYWAQILGYLQAAGDNASTSSGLGGLLTAMAPLQKIQAIEGKLGAELKKNAGA